jgi:hypothetical protein
VQYLVQNFAHGFAFWHNGTDVICRMDNAYDYGPITYASDARLKQNIRPTEVDCLDVVNRLALVQFDWLADDRHEPIGFTTQQVADVLYEAVNHASENRPPSSVPYMESIKLPAMCALLAGAVQQLMAQNTALAARVETLERRTIH